MKMSHLIKLLLPVFLFVSTAKADLSLFKHSLESFHRDLESNQLLLRHEVKRQLKEFNNQYQNDHYKLAGGSIDRYLKFLSKKLPKMNISANSRQLITKHLSNLSEIISSDSNSVSSGTNSVFLTRAVTATVPVLVNTPAVNSTKKNDLKNNVAIKNSQVPTQNSQKSAVLTRASTFVSSPVKNVRVSEKKSDLMSDLEEKYLNKFMYLLIFLVGIKLLSFALKSFRGKGTTEMTKAKRPIAIKGSKRSYQVLDKKYGTIQNPVFLVSSNEMVIWSNNFAAKVLGITKGSSFFLNHEIEKNEGGSDIYVDGTKTYSVLSKKVSLNKNVSTLYLFYTEKEKVNTADHSAYRINKTENDKISLSTALQLALSKNNYLFAEAKIPLFVQQNKSDCLIDKSEEKIISKFLQLSYITFKDTVNTRFSLICDNSGGYEKIQIDIRNANLNKIDFYQKVILSNGVEQSLIDHWHEIEMLLANRDARVNIFNNKELNGVSLQIKFISKEKKTATRRVVTV